MTIQFPTSGSPVTLGDDLNTLDGGRYTIEVEEWGGASKVQEEELPEPAGGVPFLAPLGNVKNKFGFTTTFAYPNIDAASADFQSKLALLNRQDTLVIKSVAGFGSKTFTYANAILCGVDYVKSKSSGVRWAIKYQFRLGTLTMT